ncbi:MAG: AAA family ATPase [Ignavibacteria bacterium]|nr:AAA family ATPase [Ignavibacteria bacterium]
MESNLDIGRKSHLFENQQSTKHTPTSSEKDVHLYLYEFIKSYLYRMYSRKEESETIEVLRMIGITDDHFVKPHLVSVSDEFGKNDERVSNANVDITLRYHNALYDVALRRIREHGDIINKIFCLGLEMQSKLSEELLQYIIRESVQHSPYRNAFLEVEMCTNQWTEDSDDVFVRPINFGEEHLSHIFLPENILSHISLFIQALSQHHVLQKPLRYLFAGKPGTAKTKIIRAIANACKGKATFVFTNGNEHRIESLFQFIDLFSPVVLCVDDIDLMTGSREEGLYTKQLANFLQKMDGFVKRDFFLLATTNDKRLVDLAASRPGRFDLIIDVNVIDSNLYLSLVESKTKSEEIISLFDDEVLSEMKRKKVTGAFIANLVKHLEIVAAFEREKLTQEYVLQMIGESFRGFYKEPEPTNGRTGFVLA